MFTDLQNQLQDLIPVLADFQISRLRHPQKQTCIASALKLCLLALIFTYDCLVQAVPAMLLGAKEDIVYLPHPAVSWQVWQTSVLLFCRETSVSSATAVGVIILGFPYPKGDSGQVKGHEYFSH